MSKLVILGRNGVINHDMGHPITHRDAWEAIPGSLEAIARLNQAGYHVAIATNQPGLASGELELDALNAIHHKLHDQLDRLGGHVVAIAFCPHSPDAGCSCRKPATSMYLQLAERFGTSPDSLIVIGAHHADMIAAINVGARPMLVMNPDECNLSTMLAPHAVPCFDDLAQAASALLVEED